MFQKSISRVNKMVYMIPMPQGKIKLEGGGNILKKSLSFHELQQWHHIIRRRQRTHMLLAHCQRFYTRNPYLCTFRKKEIEC